MSLLTSCDCLESKTQWNLSKIYVCCTLYLKCMFTTFFPQRQVWTRKWFGQWWEVKHVWLDLTDFLPDPGQSVRVEGQESCQVADGIPFPARESCCCARRISEEEEWCRAEDADSNWAEGQVSSFSHIYAPPPPPPPPPRFPFCLSLQNMEVDEGCLQGVCAWKLVSSWILKGCQPHWVTPGRCVEIFRWSLPLRTVEKVFLWKLFP